MTEAITKAEIVSIETIKPSSPTPYHLKHFKISLLDQLAPPSFYVPIVLFYSSSDTKAFASDFAEISEKLKTSLSEVLTLYYPFCGRILKGKNASVDCNDAGVVYLEARVPFKLTDFLKNPQANEIKGFLPFDPYNPKPDHNDYDKEEPVNMAVQVSEFSCGSVGIGVCISHKVADGATAASFLHAWSEMAMENESTVAAPPMEAASLFPPRDMRMNTTSGMMGEKNIATRRFIFDGTSLSRLRARLSGCNPTRVEAVTALIWKSAMEAAAREGSSMVTHAVNIRSRMTPPLPENSMGNLWQIAASPLFLQEAEKSMELQDLAEVVRRTIRKVDGDYVSKFQGDDEAGLAEVLGSLKEVMFLVSRRGVPCYSFSSWARFCFYETNFGWGNPSWACTIGVPIKNVVILMPTRSGDGIEAWVTLNEVDMVKFEQNPDLLQFASSV